MWGEFAGLGTWQGEATGMGPKANPGGSPGVRSGVSPEEEPSKGGLRSCREPPLTQELPLHGPIGGIRNLSYVVVESRRGRSPGRNLGGLWPSRRKNPGEREDGENHRQVRCLAKAAAPCPTAKVCKGRGKSGAGSPQQPFTCSFGISGEATWPRRESSCASWHEQKISPEAVGWGRETPRLLQSFAVFCSAEPCGWASQQRAKSCAPSADRSGAGTGTRCRHGFAALSTR